MGYTAPDGNTYKYYYETDRYVETQYYNDYDFKIWSNFKIARANFYLYSGSAYTLAMLNNNGNDVVGARVDPGRHDLYTEGRNQFDSIYAPGEYLTGCYVTCINGNTPNTNGTITALLSNNDFQGFSNLESLRAYLTAPEVFQIPSFSFSGSILQGQNSSLSQGSCSLASPYTTSFSFEGKCIEKYSAPNGQVYNYKYSYYGVMTYQGYTVDFDVYSNIKIGVLSTDRRAYALYDGVKTQVDISSAPAGTYTNASQGTTPNDDKVRHNGNTGTSNHIEHCYYSRSGVNGYTLPMTQQDGYPANFSTTLPTFSTESALLEYLGS